MSEFEQIMAMMIKFDGKMDALAADMKATRQERKALRAVLEVPQEVEVSSPVVEVVVLEIPQEVEVASPVVEVVVLEVPQEVEVSSPEVHKAEVVLEVSTAVAAVVGERPLGREQVMLLPVKRVAARKPRANKKPRVNKKPQRGDGPWRNTRSKGRWKSTVGRHGASRKFHKAHPWSLDNQFMWGSTWNPGEYCRANPWKLINQFMWGSTWNPG